MCTGSYDSQDHTTCPIGYSETTNSCYMVGPNELDWGGAKVSSY